jgi:hypothetical protein
MKQLFTLLLLAVSSVIAAQAPQSIPYQAVIRNTDGSVMANTSINIIFKIHDFSATGTVVYEESHNTSSSEQGLVALNVGGGTPITGTFIDINWGNGAKFLQVLMNPGNGMIDLGTQQMMSVPYALYAANGPQGPQGPQGPPGAGGYTHFIGEYFEGGIIFHLSKDASGYEHGLILSIADISTSAPWKVLGMPLNSNSYSLWDGLSNTQSITLNGNENDMSAAQLCVNYSYSGYSDWYLPSIDEFGLILNQKYEINKALSVIDGSSLFDYNYPWRHYWTSTEINSNEAWVIGIFPGWYVNSFLTTTKSNYAFVRAIRAF